MRIVAIAKSGFGKTLAIGPIPELGIKGLDPKETYIISTTSKDLSFPGGRRLYPVTTVDKLRDGRRIITNNPDVIVQILNLLRQSPIKNIVLDDFNYVMQDYYMNNALKQGWDAPKKIGYDMGKIFTALEQFQDSEKHIIILAHGEPVIEPDGRIYMQLKTTGNMVSQYVTPEGKFDVVLIGESKFNHTTGKTERKFLVTENANYSSPKSPYGMFSEPSIPNDFGIVVEAADAYVKRELGDSKTKTPNGTTDQDQA